MKRALLIIFALIASFKLLAFDKDTCSVYIEKAKEEFLMHRNASALNLLNKARRCATKPEEKIFIYDLSSLIYENFNRYSNAIRYLLLKENLLRKIVDTSDFSLYSIDLFNTYIKLGQLNQKIYQYNISKDYYVKAVGIGRNLKDKKKTALAYKLLGENFFVRNKYYQALSNYYYSLKNYKSIKDTSSEIEVLLKIAQIYSYQGLYKNAFESYFRVVSLSEKNPHYLSFNYFQIAKLLSELHLFDYAQKHPVKAQSYSHDSDLLVKSDILLAKIFLRKRMVDSAKSILSSALRIVPQKNIALLSDVYNLIGLVYLADNEYEQAYKYILISYNFRQKLRDKLRLALSYLSLGRYYLIVEDYKRAEIYLRKSYNIFNKMHNYYYLQLNAFSLSHLYKKIHNYQLAFEYLDRYRQIEDSIVKRNQTYILSTLEEKSKNDLEKKLIQQKLKLTQKYYSILKIFTLILFLFLLIAFYLSNKLRKMNQLLRLQTEQQEKANKEIQKRYIYIQGLYIATYLSKNSIFVTAPDGTILWFNKACQELYDLDNSAIGKNLKQLSSYNKINQVFELVNQKKTVRYISCYTFNNRRIWLHTTISPLIRKGRVYEIIAIEHDVTGYVINSIKIKHQQKELKIKNHLLEQLNEELRKQQEELARKNKELTEQQKKLIQQQEELRANAEVLGNTVKKLRQFSIAIESIDNMIFFINKNTEIIWANKAFVRKTDFDLTYLKKPLASKKWLNNLFDQCPDFKYYYQKVYREKHSVSFIRSIKYEGHNLWLQTTLSPIYNSNNEIENIVVIQTDITKLKKAEEKLALKNKEIISSMQYAKRIQQALLPMRIFLQAVFYKNYFIFFKPKDIVSGDFYWARAHKGKILFAVADGTGHGIPGAFMSVIGTMSLNAVSEKLEKFNASNFLAELKETISLILRQRGKKDEARDSIDLAFCIFDFSKKTLEFAGAYIPLYLLRKNTEKKHIELLTLTANKSTIGFDLHHTSIFESHTVQLQEGDMIYITTDGFIDQFGGINNKKYKKHRFVELIKRVYGLPINDQFAIIKHEFNIWKGDNQQVDDVLVFGLRIDNNLI